MEFEYEIFKEALILLEDFLLSIWNKGIKQYRLPDPERGRDAIPHEIFQSWKDTCTLRSLLIKGLPMI